MSRFTDCSAAALDVQYAEFGEAASYMPPGGGVATSCTVILDRADRALDLGGVGGFGRPQIEGAVLEVRKSEIIAPSKGGVFTITASSEALKVLDDPKAADPDRLEWSMTVG